MALSDATIPDLSGSGSNGDDGVLRIPKSPTLLEPHHQIVLCHKQDTRWGGFLPLYRGAVGVFYSPSRLGNTQS